MTRKKSNRLPAGKIRVVAEPGRKVRKPNGDPLADEGEVVDRGPYWQRRFDDGDISIHLDAAHDAAPEETPEGGKSK